MTNSNLKKKYSSDSSSDIWKEYYEPFYRNIGWDFWSIFDFSSLKQDRGRFYVACRSINQKYGEKYINCLLGGEMDFNFLSCPDKPQAWQKRKYEYYKEIILKDDKMTQNDKEKAYQLLEKCADRQYQCYNMSVFFRTGGLNNLKGKMSQDRRALDRFDVYIYILNDYFCKRKNQRKSGFEEDYMHIIFSESWHSSIENRKVLYEYLTLYNDIDDYFKKNYCIDDKKLIRDLIKSGSKPINCGKRVVEYMNLAERYWNAKEIEVKRVLAKKMETYNRY